MKRSFEQRNVTKLFNSVTITHTNNLLEISSIPSFHSSFYYYLIVITTKAPILHIFAHLFSICVDHVLSQFTHTQQTERQYKNLQVDCIIKG